MKIKNFKQNFIAYFLFSAMIRIGLTGGIASGKSTSLKIMRELGCHTISSDDINDKLMKTNASLRAQLKKEFNCIDESTGMVNKKMLGRIVFKDPVAKQKLESLTHPYIRAVRKSFFEKCEEKGVRFAVCESPLIFERSLMHEFDYTILIVAPLDVKIDRFIKSGKGDQEKFFTISKNQFLDAKKTEHADYVIKNSKDIKHLKSEIERTLREIEARHENALNGD